jgi:histidine ammonia-lyase
MAQIACALMGGARSDIESEVMPASVALQAAGLIP